MLLLSAPSSTSTCSAGHMPTQGLVISQNFYMSGEAGALQRWSRKDTKSSVAASYNCYSECTAWLLLGITPPLKKGSINRSYSLQGPRYQTFL